MYYVTDRKVNDVQNVSMSSGVRYGDMIVCDDFERNVYSWRETLPTDRVVGHVWHV